MPLALALALVLTLALDLVLALAPVLFLASEPINALEILLTGHHWRKGNWRLQNGQTEKTPREIEAAIPFQWSWIDFGGARRGCVMQ